jgi:hypothetical protein
MFLRAVYRRKGSIPGFSFGLVNSFFTLLCSELVGVQLEGRLECAGSGQNRKCRGASDQESREGWKTRELLYLLYLVVVLL